jgi:hypothetical protein
MGLGWWSPDKAEPSLEDLNLAYEKMGKKLRKKKIILKEMVRAFGLLKTEKKV